MFNVEFGNVFQTLHVWIVPRFEIFADNTTGLIVCLVVSSTSLYLTSRLTKYCVHGFADTILLGMHKLNGVDGFSARTLDFLHRRFVRGFLDGQCAKLGHFPGQNEQARMLTICALTSSMGVTSPGGSHHFSGSTNPNRKPNQSR
jgi:hypothetical protein